MLEYLDLSHTIPKPEYQARLRPLQQRLYELEHAVFNAKVPVAIVFEGWSASGKGRIISLLAERMDPRGFRVVPVTAPRTAETHYPWMWRFWLKVPAQGQMVAFDTSWYRRVLLERLEKTIHKDDLARAYQEISEFEEQLAADGTIIMKFWLQISKEEHENRIKKLLEDELTAWQVSTEDRLQLKKYEKFSSMVEDMLARTDSPYAPWTIVEANDKRFARIKVLETTISAIESALKLEPTVGENAKPRSDEEEMKGAVNA